MVYDVALSKPKRALLSAIYFLGVFACISFSAPVHARPMGGGADGGGGCGVYIQGRWVLKDFARYGLEVADLSSSPGTRLELGPVGRRLGGEIIDGRFGSPNIQNSIAFRLARSRLEMWKSDTPFLAELLLRALENIRFFAVPQNLKPNAFGCTGEDEFPIMIYSSDEMAAVLSLPTWSRLSLESQAGVLVKESLRVLQDQMNVDLFNGEGLTEVNEMKLSSIVSLVIFESPVEGHQYLLKVLGDSDRRNAGPSFLELPSLIESEAIAYCEYALPKYKEVYPILTEDEEISGLKPPEGLLKPCENLLRSNRLEFDEYSVFEKMVLYIDFAQMQYFLQSAKQRVEPTLWPRTSEFKDLVNKMAWFSLKYMDSDPSIQKAINSLSAITESLKSCAENSTGSDTCKLSGQVANEMVYEAIFAGEPLAPQYQRAAEEIKKHISRSLLGWVR